MFKKFIVVFIVFVVLVSSFACTKSNDLSDTNLRGNVKSLKEYHADPIKKFGEWAPKDDPGSTGYMYITYYDRSGNETSSEWFWNNELSVKIIITRDGNETFYNAYEEDGIFRWAFSKNSLNKNETIYNDLDENMNITDSTKEVYVFKNGKIKSIITYDQDGNEKGKTINTIKDGKIVYSVSYDQDGKEERKWEYKHDNKGNVIYINYTYDGKNTVTYTEYTKHDKNGNWIESFDFEDSELTKAKWINIREIEYY